MAEWKDIKDTNHQISSDGKVRHKIKKNILKIHTNDGYEVSRIRKEGKMKEISIHREVAIAFVPNPDNKPNVNHKNGDKKDNRAENLEWCTQRENVHHALDSGLTRVHVKPIIQYSLDGKEICRYNSMKEMEEKYPDFDRSRIIKVCKGKGIKAYNYKWKYVEAYEETKRPEGKVYEDYNNYIFTTEGKVYSISASKYLEPMINGNRHAYITLCKKNRKKINRYIHSIVAKLFIENPNNYKNVIHINKDRSDNRVENLQWKNLRI